MDSKTPWQSKTLWISLLMGISAFFPVVKSWISSHPDVFAEVMAGIFFALRLVTQGKINIADDSVPPSA